jgi:hypothetical protein
MFKKLGWLFVILVITSILTLSVYSQGPITGDTTLGTELITLVPKSTVTIENLIGKKMIDFKFVTLDGKNNQVKIDVPYLITEFDFDTGAIDLAIDLEIFTIIGGCESPDGRHWIGIEGSIAGQIIRIELDFSPGMGAITGSVPFVDPSTIKETPIKIKLINEINNTSKILYEKYSTEWSKIPNEDKEDETKMSEKDMAQLIGLLNEPTAIMAEQISEKLYSSYCNSGQKQKKKCLTSGVVNFGKIVRNGKLAEVYIHLIVDVYIDDKVIKSYKEEVLFHVVKIGGSWKIYKK